MSETTAADKKDRGEAEFALLAIKNKITKQNKVFQTKSEKKLYDTNEKNLISINIKFNYLRDKIRIREFGLHKLISFSYPRDGNARETYW